MKRIMFSDKFGLTEAVLNREKTMTRRIIKGDYVFAMQLKHEGSFIGKTASGDSVILPQPAYNVGEEVAIAQGYSNLREVLAKRNFKRTDALYDKFYQALQMGEVHDGIPGWDNKMFVRADLMPHRIRITSTKLERLQDISDGDCYKEGIVHFEWRQYLKQDDDDFGPQQYNERDLWSVPLFRESFLNPWGESSPEEFAADSAKTAFAVLIFKMMSRKVWLCNPWVYAYEFELVK